MSKPQHKTHMFAVVVILLMAFYGLLQLGYDNTLTGAAVVKFRGISNTPIPKEAGKIQTEVTITQPELGKLQDANVAMQVSQAIVQAVDFGNSVAGLASGQAPFPLPTSALDLAISAAGAITQKFMDDTNCLRKIGATYSKAKSVKFAVVTDMTYLQCKSPYTDWVVAQIVHKYYVDGKLFCKQPGPKLFSAKLGTNSNEVKKSTLGC